MCNRTLSAVWSLDLCVIPSRQRSGAKLVLARLADRYNPKHGCTWPTMQSIADDCCMSRKTVFTHIKTLEEAGYLIVKRRFRNNSQISSEYSFNESMIFADSEDTVCNPDTPLTQSQHTPCVETTHRTITEPKSNHHNITDIIKNDELCITDLDYDDYEQCHLMTEAMQELKDEGHRLCVCKLRKEEWDTCETLLREVYLEDHKDFLLTWINVYGSGFRKEPSLPNIVCEDVNGTSWAKWLDVIMS